jgi:DNA gyrase inhibitor GyrI
METINATAREQFVTDYCLVVDNEKNPMRNIIGRQNRQGGQCLGVIG